MFEYQVTVSTRTEGFLFRTEWDDNKERVAAAAVILQSSIPLAKVEILRKSKAMTLVTPGNM